MCESWTCFAIFNLWKLHMTRLGTTDSAYVRYSNSVLLAVCVALVFINGKESTTEHLPNLQHYTWIRQLSWQYFETEIDKIPGQYVPVYCPIESISELASTHTHHNLIIVNNAWCVKYDHFKLVNRFHVERGTTLVACKRPQKKTRKNCRE